MKLKSILILSLCLTMTVGGALTSCRRGGGDTDTSGQATAPHTTPSETVPNGSEEETEKEEAFVEPILTGPYADTIMLSNQLANGVQAYYANPKRSVYRIENQSMTLDYSLSGADKLITSLRNKAGSSYLENAMDVFITMEDGKTYLASQSTASPYTNIYRMSYYYYDAHIMGQNFMGGATIAKEMPFIITKSTVKFNQATGFSVKDGVISYTANGDDPYAYTTQNKSKEGLCFSATEYNAVQFSVKSTSTEGYLFFIAGQKTGHSSEQSIRFDMVPNGEWNTYTVVLNTVPDYTDVVTSLRFDIGNPGEEVQIKDIKAVKLDTQAPSILLDRTFHTYSDKMNQVLHFVANEETHGITGMGFVTAIPADTVDQIAVKDKNGVHDSLSGVDFTSVEYVGFDIRGTGILGFILLPHENSGKLDISLENGSYTVTQTAIPENGVLLADPDTTADDFYMGHRLYTDASHSFDGFLREAEAERHPLASVSGETYQGYDALRGAYRLGIGSTGFNDPFFSEQNRHYSCDITVSGDDGDRTVYFYTHGTSGCGENAVILDERKMLLPIPVMICKNFKGENEEPVFDPGDPSYSETYFPLSVKAGSTTALTVLNLYMNWGQMPLKQLSSIQFFWPYYHLSLGVTETSCISPLYGARDLWTLPDFRSMSMPYWFELPVGQGFDNQPQHTHAGYQYFLQYTDADGNYAASENYHNHIQSSGPVYTDVKMDYISDDGRIKVSYNHMELPETDELRAYYEIRYEVLEDISIADFAKDFSFYSLEGYAGAYRKLGYLDENNKPAGGIVNAKSNPVVTKLGDQFPYIALYDLNATSDSFRNNNANLGVIVYDSDFTIGGKDCDAGFVMVGQNSRYSLSLDLGATTLKKGDTMSLSLIIVPWGFYTSTDDSNMQRIRENTCLNGLKLTVQDGEVMDSVYLPKVKSSNGKSAEFTVTGGSGNKAIRVYGFQKLTAPKVYEKINGKWVELTLSSVNTPDTKGYAHPYDGYAVYYDRNGTYSYAFAFNMDGIESRTFKVTADEDFAGWPNMDDGDVQEHNLTVYEVPAGLKLSADGGTGVGRMELAEDKSYLRLYGHGEAGETFFQVFSNGNQIPTGAFLLVKCRIPETNQRTTEFEFFISTEHTGAHAGDSFYIRGIPADGQWHYVIADLTKQGLPTFEPGSTGIYTAQHLRFDVFNGVIPATEYVDIGYVAMAGSLEDICSFQKTGLGELYESGTLAGTIDFATGKEPGNPGGNGNAVQNYVHPDSGYTVSDVRYASMIDFINGTGDGDGPFDARGTNSDKPLDKILYNGATADGGKLVLAGWAVAEGGIDRYMWSHDGGKTWQACTLYNRSGFDNVTENAGISASADQFFSSTGYRVSSHPDKIVFQGSEGTVSGICADLSVFAGQTMDVVFAVVPTDDTDGLCIMTVVQGVTVEP